MCNGGDLREYMDHVEDIPLEVTQHVIRSVVKALIVMHEEFKLIHRDLKPENILLHLEGANPQIKKKTV